MVRPPDALSMQFEKVSAEQESEGGAERGWSGGGVERRGEAKQQRQGRKYTGKCSNGQTGASMCSKKLLGTKNLADYSTSDMLTCYLQPTPKPRASRTKNNLMHFSSRRLMTATHNY